MSSGSNLPNANSVSLPSEAELAKIANAHYGTVGIDPSHASAPSATGSPTPSLHGASPVQGAPSSHGAPLLSPGLAPSAHPAMSPTVGALDLNKAQVISPQVASGRPHLAGYPLSSASPPSPQNISHPHAAGSGTQTAIPQRAKLDSLDGARIGYPCRYSAATVIPSLGLKSPSSALSSPGLGSPGLGSPGLSTPGLSPSGVGTPGLSIPGLGSSGLGTPRLGATGQGSPGLAAPASGQSRHGAPGPSYSNEGGVIPDGTQFARAVESPSYYFLPANPSNSPGRNHDQLIGHAVQPASRGAQHRPLNVESIRRDFPILQEKINGHQLVWLDNAATTQKPQVVIDRLVHFYQHENSNIHRAAHALAARATDAYEHARKTVAGFLGASSSDNIVFTRGATEAINLVAKTYGRQVVGSNDEIVLTALEHHANIVPWQQLAQDVGAVIKVAPVDDHGDIILAEYQRLIGPRTKIVSFTQVANALGTVTPAAEMIAIAHRQGAKVLLDGAQSVSHMPVDVSALDCDFYVFSGHKAFAPTGIGALYGKSDVFEHMAPWQGGGNMIRDVNFDHTVYQDAPMRFEAGTGNIADAAGLAAALEYLQLFGLDAINKYEHALMEYALEALRRVPGLRLIGSPQEQAGAISLVMKQAPPTEIASALNQKGIAVRAGHHCAQPILRRFGLEATVRPSLALYNTHGEIDQLVEALREIASVKH